MRLKISVLHKTAFHLIWEIPLKPLPRWQRLLITVARVVHLIIRDLAEGQLTMRAMGLVYTTLLSMVPLLAVSFSVLKGFGVHNQVKPMLLRVLAPLGEKGIEITNQIIGFVDNIKVGVLGSLGLALLFYTVISLLQKIERAFNYTWRVEEIRPLHQRFSDYLTVIMIGPVLIFTAIGLTASVSSHTIVQQLMGHPLFSLFFTYSAYILPYVIMTITFSFIYVLFPNTRVKISAALVGGLVASILWQFTGWAFATFVVNSTKYTAIYSVFATLIIFLIWLYLSWLILLIGCSIAFYTQHHEYRNLQVRVVRLSNRVREKIGLLIMTQVGRHYFQKKPAWTVNALADELNVGADTCGRIVAGLCQGGLLVQSGDDPPALLPACSLEVITLRDIIDTIRSNGERVSISPDDIPADPEADAICTDIENGIIGALGERSLREIVLPASNAGSHSS
ncbi:MAG: YihY/virulence factor BrkB family protein [Proteobacteria bacterium]|jgi:membrane protein|nr:YihY/virulence factor BrkB family protein [Pseudomonadota bacterium]